MFRPSAVGSDDRGGRAQQVAPSVCFIVFDAPQVAGCWSKRIASAAKRIRCGFAAPTPWRAVNDLVHAFGRLTLPVSFFARATARLPSCVLVPALLRNFGAGVLQLVLLLGDAFAVLSCSVPTWKSRPARVVSDVAGLPLPRYELAGFAEPAPMTSRQYKVIANLLEEAESVTMEHPLLTPEGHVIQKQIQEVLLRVVSEQIRAADRERPPSAMP